jgi:DnaK suppressor protein
VKPPKKTKAEQAADVKSEAETFAAAKAAAARLAALAGLRPIESRPFQDSAAEGESKRLTKSPLSKKELDHYRQLLLMKRAEILGDVESMEGEALLSGDRMSHTPSHMAEQGSDVSSQSLSLDIAATQRKLLGEIDAALRRIEDGTYGVCTVMGSAIGKARLDAKPWASLCIEAARRLERGAYAS